METAKPPRDDQSPVDARLKALFDAKVPKPDPARLEAEAAATWRRLQQVQRDASALPGRPYRRGWRAAAVSAVLVAVVALGVTLSLSVDTTDRESSHPEEIAAERILAGVAALSSTDLTDMTERLQSALQAAQSRSRDQWHTGMLEALEDADDEAYF